MMDDGIWRHGQGLRWVVPIGWLSLPSTGELEKSRQNNNNVNLRLQVAVMSQNVIDFDSTQRAR